MNVTTVRRNPSKEWEMSVSVVVEKVTSVECWTQINGDQVMHSLWVENVWIDIFGWVEWVWGVGGVGEVCWPPTTSHCRPLPSGNLLQKSLDPLWNKNLCLHKSWNVSLFSCTFSFSLTPGERIHVNIIEAISCSRTVANPSFPAWICGQKMSAFEAALDCKGD